MSGRGSIGVGSSVGIGNLWVNWRQGVGQFFLAIACVERRWDVGLAIGWRHGLSGRGFSGLRQCESLGQSLGKRRL